MSLDNAWDRIETWLSANAPDVRKSLRPAARPSAVQKAEAALGVRLPLDFAASVRRHDGQRDEAESGLLPQIDKEFQSEPAWRLLPLSEIVEVWRQLVKLHDIGDFAGQSTEPAPGVQAVWWCPGWVPVADNGAGDHLCLDTTPGEGGQVGQIVVFLHDAPWRPLAAGSFEELLTRLADGMESGQYVFDPGEGLVGTTNASGSEQPVTRQLVGQVVLLPVERPTGEQLRVVHELSRQQHANLLEVRKVMIAGGFREFGIVMDPGLTQLLARLDQAGIPYRLEPLSDT